eukprot:CAMPEP_0172502804 /NCGR_PEP_ID=MMETSP1066-20121228/162885_1 /TAXON_ID=671091 /ORGANISM="Coscinodiscus wailesii, Strain CCMP2513" /LENGTH=104 /DNA_ID=CAMNT_0013278191 /DNA_START=61 /DNA_END=370 /DNA_ORIENTATION=-
MEEGNQYVLRHSVVGRVLRQQRQIPGHPVPLSEESHPEEAENISLKTIGDVKELDETLVRDFKEITTDSKKQERPALMRTNSPRLYTLEFNESDSSDNDDFDES